jgi:UDP-4-amino-4,6-dideoxy-N-acetyl-beta-L-altrosamine N-acetyltransferase
MYSELRLINLEEKHIEMVRQWRNMPEVSEYMYTSDVISPDQQNKWYRSINSDPTCKYWIIEYSGRSLGLASLSGISKTLDSCYWAYYLGDSSVRGKGIGAKVEFSVITYVFDTLKLNKLRCEVFTFNEKVISLHEKFGFRREAYYRQHCFKNNEYRDVVGLALLKSEWDIIKQTMKLKIYGE